MILVSWNCRGMGSSLKTNAVRDLIKAEQPDFLLLQETKISDLEFQQSIVINSRYEGIATSAIGASGGLGILWGKNKWTLKNNTHNRWWIRIDMQSSDQKEKCTIYNVYAPTHYRDKAACWESLKVDMDTTQGEEIYLGGDLNLIRNTEEKLGGKYFTDPFRDNLEEIIQAHKLIDIPPQNGRFTWSNKRTGRNNIKERLDRILVQEKAAANFQRIHSSIIQGYTSDHKPVVLRLEKEEDLGPLPFKYNKAWDAKEDFKSLVKEAWKTEILGSPHFVWESKIKLLRIVIKHWAKDFADKERREKNELQRKLESWNKDKESVQETEEDQRIEEELCKALYNQQRKEEEELRQKSRCLWLNSGDKNTSFFHNCLKVRRAGNNIGRINHNGKEITDNAGIKEAASDHFQTLLTADPQYEDSSDFVNIIEEKVTEAQNCDLDKEITMEEVELAISSMPLDKAPGPDGFTVSFYKTHWETIKKDFIRMVRNFQRKNKLGSSVKSSFLALIPKDPNPQSYDRFRPISLCNVSYKIISKILANRLKRILPSIISDNQGGFLPKRHISDNVILIQEAIHSSVARQEKGMIIKLDMASAFDRVNHSFLEKVLTKFGISRPFINKVMECVTQNWTAPLINGRPCRAFKSTRGLRQGCPLSPFLYIIMAETLSLHLENKRRTKEITGVDIIRGTKGINHSLFADDTLLIGGASSLMARRFKIILDLFLQASGGKLNNNKCKIYTWNVPRHITQRISRILEIPAQLSWTHFMYLGLPLARESIKSEVWANLVEKMRGKLQGWGMQWLNLAGRTVLIKSVLSALPIYQFAITLAPSSIHKHMELILRSFLWKGGKQETKKFSLVKWDKVTLPIEKGGLGIRVPRLANLAMGFKLIWRIITEQGTWWAEILKKKYLSGSNSNILADTIAERPCTPVWKMIKKALPLLKTCISKVPGNGKQTSIWNDRIMGQEAKEKLPHLRQLQQWMMGKNLTSLYDISEWEQDRWKGWKIRSIPNRLREQWNNLKLSLAGAAPSSRGKEDSFIWDPNGGSYSVKEGYKALQAQTALNNWQYHKSVWKIESLPKIKFFNWTLLHGKLLTAENLKKKGIQGPSICFMCKNSEESLNHLFIECPIASVCWKQIASPLDIGDLPAQIPLLQKGWGKLFPTASKNSTLAKRFWASIPPNLCWQIWLARNACIFKDKKPNVHSILARTIALTTETIEENGIQHPDPEYTVHQVKEWMQKFKHRTSPKRNQIKSSCQKVWKLRGTKEEIINWIQGQKMHTLYFDGASKNNPGIAGAGGVIRDQQGRMIINYEWSLGKLSNNKAEAYSLLQGITIARKSGIRDLLVLGDSAILIAAMNSGNSFKQFALNRIRERIMEQVSKMGNVAFKHVLRNYNTTADELANKAIRRPASQVRENDKIYAQDIP